MPADQSKSGAQDEGRKEVADADESACPDDELWRERNGDMDSVSDVDEPSGGFSFEDPDERLDKPSDEEE